MAAEIVPLRNARLDARPGTEVHPAAGIDRNRAISRRRVEAELFGMDELDAQKPGHPAFLEHRRIRLVEVAVNYLRFGQQVVELSCARDAMQLLHGQIDFVREQRPARLAKLGDGQARTAGSREIIRDDTTARRRTSRGAGRKSSGVRAELAG